ncbi:hypothetical protein BCM14_2813 [Jezberella montanilacus]|uniref:Haloacid dehalogenase-like hydrolase n=1 Tax=Jezberella montanilacus TaxID=323426 RepID=A0A2T0XCE1_9BURK|nr:hypothetical protein [Jezberella montanilacus]PRY96572.1 hypothetical protein BCM14_2813 [Jezberella montanilacus]
MRIGIDFDNTIVSYDELFYQIAQEKKLIPAELPVNKVAVRNHLRSIDQEAAWTLMQGEAYGLRMNDAKAYPLATNSISALKLAGHDVYIVSHKTKHPFMGPSYDLHQSARDWIDANLVFGCEQLFKPTHIFYELTKEEKIARVNSLNCDVFIDDLPEILSMSGFPPHTRKILFDPEHQHPERAGAWAKANSWQAVVALVLS